MILNSSADWSQGEINVMGDMVDHFWTPDIIIHDLVGDNEMAQTLIMRVGLETAAPNAIFANVAPYSLIVAHFSRPTNHVFGRALSMRAHQLFMPHLRAERVHLLSSRFC